MAGYIPRRYYVRCIGYVVTHPSTNCRLYLADVINVVTATGRIAAISGDLPVKFCPLSKCVELKNNATPDYPRKMGRPTLPLAYTAPFHAWHLCLVSACFISIQSIMLVITITVADVIRMVIRGILNSKIFIFILLYASLAALYIAAGRYSCIGLSKNHRCFKRWARPIIRIYLRCYRRHDLPVKRV